MFSDYSYFVRQIHILTKIDLSMYKEGQMKRRIDGLISKYKMGSYAEYLELIKNNKDKLNEFVEFITINVSEFYRNPEQWDVLVNTVIPGLLEKGGRRLKIWSAACSTGDEPYSLVMALSEFVPMSMISVIATDISEEAINKAKTGVYGKKSISGLPKRFVDKYFTEVNNSYILSDEIKKHVEFRKHDLLADKYFDDCDLIVCRNVLIYFTEEAKRSIFNKFYNSLKTNGILFIGSTEQIVNYRDIGFKRLDSFFYEK